MNAELLAHLFYLLELLVNALEGVVLKERRVQERAEIEAVIVRTILIRMEGRRECRHLMAVYGVVVVEPLYFLSCFSRAALAAHAPVMLQLPEYSERTQFVDLFCLPKCR